MSTVNNMLGSSYDSTTMSTSTSKKLSSLQSELSSVSSSTTLSDTQKQEKLDKINKEISSIQTASATMSNSNAASSSALMSAMLGSGGSDTGGASSDLVSAIFSSSATLTNIKTLYSCSNDIKNQARTLAGEIAVDKARGVDTTDKQAKLTNLTSNVSIVDKSLKSKVNTALETVSKSDTETISVIDEIKKSLEAGEKTAKAEAAEDIKEITGEYPEKETEETE